MTLSKYIPSFLEIDIFPENKKALQLDCQRAGYCLAPQTGRFSQLLHN